MVAIMVVGAGLAILCSAVFSYHHGYKLRSDGAGLAMQRVAEGLAEEIDTSLNAAVSLLSQLSKAPHIQQSLAEENRKYKNLSDSEVDDLVIQEMAIWKASRQPQALLQILRKNELAGELAEFAGKNPGFQSIRIIDQAGIVVAAYGQIDSPNASQQSWWRQTNAQEYGQPRIYAPILYADPAAVVVPIAVPIGSNGPDSAQGTLYAEYNLNGMVFREGSEEIVAFLLGNENGKSLLLLNSAQGPATVSEFADAEKFQSGKTGRTEVQFGHGITAIAGFAPVVNSAVLSPSLYKGGEWTAITAISQDMVIGPLNSLFLQALIFSTIVLILLSLGSLAFARRTLKPIRVLQQGVQEIGQGNLEHRIDIRSGDEIEVLAVEFNRMAERMQRAQEQLQRHSKELEQKVNQLRRLQAQLMQSERMAATGELAAQIAHEINNPLGIIKNYVGIAKMLMPEEDPNRENMKIVDQEINRIAGIVRRLLKFAKPGGEDIQPVQINQVLEELLALLRGQLFRKKIEISSELAENLPEVSVSTDQIRQVFLNLIKNAEDAMADGGKLKIRTRYRKGRVEIDVADDGCGIPPENIKNIFEPFFTTKGVKGTGLGLTVSYGIIKNYNGEITVDSEPGRGTTFTIQLPVVSDKVFQVIQSP
jgi:signal transduction histidine kinase